MEIKIDVGTVGCRFLIDVEPLLDNLSEDQLAEMSDVILKIQKKKYKERFKKEKEYRNSR